MSTSRPTGLIVAVIILGAIMLPLSMSGASVAVPDIGADLGARGSATSWVVTGYFLAASSLMLVVGSVADNLGRRRVYRTGAIVYTAGAVIATVAPTVSVLLAGRVISGAGAAAIMATGAATAAATFEGPSRTRMFAALGTAVAMGLAAGPVVSGALVEGLGWRGTFAVFASAGLALLVGSAVLPESRREDRAPIDWTGAALVVAGLCALMLAIAGAPGRGWSDPGTVIAVVVAVICLTSLVGVERRLAEPVVDLGLLRNPAFAGWLLALATVSIGYAGLLAHLPSFLHSILDMSPSESGLIMLVPILPMVALPVLVGQISTRIPARHLIVPALAFIAIGNAWLGLALGPDVSVIALALPLLTIGLGLGTATGIVDAHAMNQVDPDRHGLAAGMVNTVRGASTTLTMALLGSALVALIAATSGEPGRAGRLATGSSVAGRPDLAAAISDAWLIAQLVLAAVCAISAIVVALLLRQRERHPAVEDDVPLSHSRLS